MTGTAAASPVSALPRSRPHTGQAGRNVNTPEKIGPFPHCGQRASSAARSRDGGAAPLTPP